jgi:hypothetical protein
MDKWDDLAHRFVRGLTDEQRKELGVLIQHDEGYNALEDESAGALHDQACEGDEEAMLVLQADPETLEKIFKS